MARYGEEGVPVEERKAYSEQGDQPKRAMSPRSFGAKGRVCGTGSSTYSSHEHEKLTGGREACLRIMHSIPRIGPLKVTCNGKILISNITYQGISDYISLPAGKHEITIYSRDDGVVVAGAITFMEKSYTIVIYGGEISAHLLALADDNTSADWEMSAIRFVHAIPVVGNLDLYVSSTQKFSSVAYGRTGDPVYQAVEPGTQTITVAPAGTRGMIANVPIYFEAGKVYTVVASGIPSDSTYPPTILIAVDSDCARVHVY